MIAVAPENIVNETRLTMAEMVRWQNVSHNTVENWMRKGRKGIRLARVRIGGRWFTSKEAFQRWIEAINRADLDNSRIARASQRQQPSQRRSLVELAREAEEAVAALK